MATVHLGKIDGPAGFSRAFAIKRLHPQFARDPSFVAMFLDEARIASRLRHPNVVPIVDVVSEDGELFLVMDYVHGEAWSRLLRAADRSGNRPALPIVSSVMAGMLDGLHAAHQATGDMGEPLHIVHRDVSPQNVLVGVDGVARITDFGVAKAARRLQDTNTGRLKGKLPYMAPEQYSRDDVDHRVDVFAAGIVLWEAVTGRRLFVADEPARVMNLVLHSPIPPASEHNPSVPPALDAVIARALERDRTARFQSAREMAVALERAVPPAPAREVGEWVQASAASGLEQRSLLVQEVASGERAIPSLREVRRALVGDPSETSLIVPDGETLGDDLTRPMPLEGSQPAAARTLVRTLTDLAKRPVSMGVGAGLVLFAGAFVLVVAARPDSDETAAPPSVLRSGLALMRPKLAEARAAASVEEIQAADPSDVEVIPEEPAPAPATARAAPKSASKRTPARCNPPYVKGADGIVRFKRECLDGAK